MSSSAGQHRTLGIIWPYNGPDQPEYEYYRLNEWLDRRGITGLRSEVDLLPSPPLHTHEDLFENGRLEHLLPAAKRLADKGCEAILWACTSASFIGGLQWCRDQSTGLAEATGLPSSSTTLALIEAAEAVQAERLDLLCAYPQPVTKELVACLTDAGFEVGAVAWLDSPHAAASFEMDMIGEVKRFARAHPETDHPLVIPDTAIDTLDLVEAFEEVSGRTVITSNQATLRQGMRMLGLDPTLAGLGRLFERFPATADS